MALSSHKQYNPESLKRMCLHCVVTRIQNDEYLDDVFLPPSVMDDLYRALMLRGLIKDGNMHLLFHTHSREADLRKCSVTAKGLSHLKKCSKLTLLKLGPWIRSPADEEGLCEILTGLQNLRQLRLEGGDYVKSSVVSMLSRQNPTLTVVGFSGCRNVDDECLFSLGQNCPILERVDFSCSQITDAGIASLCSSPCRLTLQEVILNDCRHITGCAIESLYNSCPGLSTLMFGNCPLVQGCPRFSEGPKNLLQISWSVPM